MRRQPVVQRLFELHNAAYVLTARRAKTACARQHMCYSSANITTPANSCAYGDLMLYLLQVNIHMNYQLRFLVLSGFLVSCGNSHQQQQWGDNGPQPFPAMKLLPANAVLNEDYPASIEGRENIEIRPKVEGFIEKILVDEGATVKRGQLLFRISAPQYEQELRTAAAAIRSAQADVNTALTQVKKAGPLVAKKVVSPYELENARFNLEAKEAVLAQAKASLANAQTNLGYTAIVSPVDGVVGQIPYRTGSLVSSASPQPLTTISDTRRIYAYFSLNEKQLLDFSESGNVEEGIRKFPAVSLVLANGKVYEEEGKLETVGGQINSSTGAATFRAGFENPKAMIRSGASARIRITKPLENVLVLPQKATFDMQDKKFVYVVDAAGMVKSREVFVNPITYGQQYVIDSGLVAGDMIVTDGMGNLKDGMKIIPTDPSKPAPQQAKH